MTLYTFDGDARVNRPASSLCESLVRLKAAELAKPIGDWTVAIRDDGSRNGLQRQAALQLQRRWQPAMRWACWPMQVAPGGAAALFLPAR